MSTLCHVWILDAVGNLSSGTGYLSLDCYLSDNGIPKSLRRLTITILYPFLIFFVYIALWGCYTLVKRRDSRYAVHMFLSSAQSVARSYFNQRILLTLLAINYFVYIGMTKTLLRFFACVHVTEDREGAYWKRYVWAEDTEIECFHGRHALLVVLLVVPLLLVISFGYPAGVFIILWFNKDRLNEEEFVQTYGFLYRAYKRRYWEVAIMARKAAVAIIAAFSYRLGSNIQGLLCILVILIALSAHLVVQPFTEEIPQLNRLETSSLSTTIIVFSAGLMMNDEKIDHRYRSFVSLLVIVFVCATVVAILMHLVFATEEFIDMKLVEVEAMNIQDVIDTRLSRKTEVLAGHYWRVLVNGAKTQYAQLTRKVPQQPENQNKPGTDPFVSPLNRPHK